ncbi:MAG: FecR domain-containing protein [Bacteroidota bacterium]
MGDPEVEILLSKWLAGTLTEAEKAQLAQSEDLSSLRVVVNDIASWSVGEWDTAQGLALLKRQQAERKKRSMRRRISYSIAAGIGVLLIVATLWQILIPGTVQVRTGIAEVKELVFPDGSLMKLDAMTQVSYNKNKWAEARHVTLQGQAFFDVKAGNSFEVHTPSGVVSVLGTRFNIKAVTEHLLVECYSGNVQVAIESDQQIIGSGEKLSLVDGVLRKQSHSRTVPDWEDSLSIYEETPLQEVVQDLSRYFEVDIQLPNQYAHLAFSGQVSQTDLTLALKSIFLPMGIDYSQEDKGRVVIRQ